MASINKVMIIGNLTADPLMKFTPNGAAVTTFSIAVNKKWTDTSGNKQERVQYINCEAWNKPAEAINQYVTKGQPLYVEGKLRTETWDDKETGQKKSRVIIKVSEFQFIASKPRDEQGSAPQRQAPVTRKQTISDDELPF